MQSEVKFTSLLLYIVSKYYVLRYCRGDSHSLSRFATAAYCGGPLCHSFLVTSPHFMGSDPQRGSLPPVWVP